MSAPDRSSRAAVDALLPEVYHELRRRARSLLDRERDGHTLDSAALVHEAYDKLVTPEPLAYDDRAHFVAVTVRAMRQVLVSYARRHNAEKRGNALRVRPAHLDLDGGGPTPLDILAFEDALDRLGRIEATALAVTELHGLGGLSLRETADYLGVSRAKVRRLRTFAKRWLAAELGHAPT
jgi:RNA polymerase sigma factor (TIGR02999 family)